LIGQAKAGTTSLAFLLSNAEKIFVPSMKEPHFYSQITPEKRQRYFSRYVSSEQEYSRLYDWNGEYDYWLDASPSYLNSAVAMQKIAAEVSDAKIIVCVRDPVDRLISHYLMDTREGLRKFTSDIVGLVKEDFNREDKGWGRSSLYLDLGIITDDIVAYEQQFGRENVLVVMFKSIVNRPSTVVNKLADFLDIDQEMSSLHLLSKTNPYMAQRGWLAKAALSSNSIRYFGYKLLPEKVRSFVKYKFLLKPSKLKPRLSDETIAFLEAFYREEKRSLSKLIMRKYREGGVV
jgi:hypothetical protein